MKKVNKKRLIYLVIIVILAAITYLFLQLQAGKSEYVFSTVTVEKGSINNTITATGTLEATNTVIVGTQVSGVIEKLYVDFNSIVKKGQLIAELDKYILQSNLDNAEADLDRANAEFEYQESNLYCNKVLYDQELIAKSDYDLVLYNYKTSKAGVKSAKASLSRAQRNLSYAYIYSPIDGLVLNREVEEGQTVAASMNTPELFTITNDLSTMQVEANVDEADIGLIKLDQRVEFTVDAFPDLNFEGKVSEIRLQPNESANVITYIVIVSVSNPELKLKPGMTASITTYVKEAKDVLLVAGKATRFNPNRQLLDNYMSSLSNEQEKPAINNSSAAKSQNKPKPPHLAMQELDDLHKIVWIKNGDIIHPVVIEVGIDDGSTIEVVSELEEGNVIVTSFELSNGSVNNNISTKNDEQNNPFVQERSGRKGGGGPPH